MLCYAAAYIGIRNVNEPPVTAAQPVVLTRHRRCNACPGAKADTTFLLMVTQSQYSCCTYPADPPRNIYHLKTCRLYDYYVLRLIYVRLPHIRPYGKLFYQGGEDMRSASAGSALRRFLTYSSSSYHIFHGLTSSSHCHCCTVVRRRVCVCENTLRRPSGGTSFR